MAEAILDGLMDLTSTIRVFHTLAEAFMAQYISKMYLEVKKRPHYIISETNDEETKKVK